MISEEIIQNKVCSRCKIEKPKTLEYFHNDGKYLSSWCKECKAKHKKEIKNEMNGSDRLRAQKSVQKKVLRGTLPSSTEFDCFLCEQPASIYFHPNPGLSRLVFVPMCRKCLKEKGYRTKPKPTLDNK